jgi:hypothetical protein
MLIIRLANISDYIPLLAAFETILCPKQGNEQVEVQPRKFQTFLNPHLESYITKISRFGSS